MLKKVLYIAAMFWLSLGTYAQAPGKSLSLWPIDVFSMGMALDPSEADAIEYIVPDLIASTLSSAGIPMVERQRLLELLSEQKLGASDLADESTRLRLGELLGAQFMLFGNFTRLGPNWQLDMRVVDTETSTILATASADQDAGELLDVAEFIAGQLARSLAASE